MHMILNTDFDTDELVFTYNNEKSQSHVISQQSSQYSRYMLLFWCRIGLAKYVHQARLFYHTCNGFRHSSDAISTVNWIPQSMVSV
jgi:hypothetical protein